ncbi:MAG: hypothetical protein Kow00114_27390 [Kiloniellaceae bacterium]
MNSPSILTVSGRRWFLGAPDAARLHWPDVAEHLAKINRHIGATVLPISVAEHCCRVSEILPPRLKPYGLLHDAHEAYLGDTIGPLKDMLRQEYGDGMLLDRLEARHDQVIHTAAGLPFPLSAADKALLKQADETMFATEVRDLKPAAGPRDLARLTAFHPEVIRPWPWPKAAERWLECLHAFCPATSAGAAAAGSGVRTAGS